jgi:hypothetical protein
MINVFGRDGERFISFGDDEICLGGANASSEIVDWSVPKQTGLAFSNGSHRDRMINASKYACPIDGKITFRAVVVGESKWRITPSFTCHVDFFVFDPTTGAFGFMPTKIEHNSTKLKHSPLELEKSSAKKERFVENSLKIFAGPVEATLESVTDEFKDHADIVFQYTDDKKGYFRPSQTVAILVESFEGDVQMDAPISTMHKCAMMVLAAHRICGEFYFAKLREHNTDDLNDARDFVKKYETRKVSAKSVKDATNLVARLQERLVQSVIDGRELKSSQNKNNERRDLLVALREHVAKHTE